VLKTLGQEVAFRFEEENKRHVKKEANKSKDTQAKKNLRKETTP